MLKASIARFNQALSSGYIMNEVVETTKYGLASAAFGYYGVKNRDKKILGMDLPLAVGVLGTAAQIGAEVMGMGGYGRTLHNLGIVSKAGIGAWAHAVGASMAAKSLKAAAPSLPPRASVVGGLPQAEGDYLTREELAALARR